MDCDWNIRKKTCYRLSNRACFHTKYRATLAKEGFAEVSYLDVDSQGFVDPEQLKTMIRDDTLLVSIIHSNNEIGTIQDIEALGSICRERGVLLHSDMAQSIGKLELNMDQLPVDLASFNCHKMHGPKGIGALYLRKRQKSADF